MKVMPLVTNIFHYHDSKVLEHASVCLNQIAESFEYFLDKLDELCNHGLVAQATRLISVSSSGGAQESLSTPYYMEQLIKQYLWFYYISDFSLNMMNIQSS